MPKRGTRQPPPQAPEPIYRLGLISDLHVGSRYALIPPRFVPATDTHPSAKFYGYMWECWQHFCATCQPMDALIINGEIAEGENPTQRDAMDAITDDLLMQADMAVETISLLMPKVKRLWVVRGTVWHEGKYFETIERIASDLHAEPWADRRSTGLVLEGEFHGLKLNVTHHQSVGAIYRGTLADRTSLFAAAAERIGKTIDADIIVRSHLHSKYIGKSHSKWFISTPAWKLPTPYAFKRLEFYRACLLSDLGAIVLATRGHGDVSWEEYEYEPYKWERRAI